MGVSVIPLGHGANSAYICIRTVTRKQKKKKYCLFSGTGCVVRSYSDATYPLDDIIDSFVTPATADERRVWYDCADKSPV